MKDKIAVVTAAGQGIRRATAVGLAKRGARVYALDNNGLLGRAAPSSWIPGDLRIATNVRFVPHCRRFDAGLRCRAREGPLFSLHCKKSSVVRSVVNVRSLPPHEGDRRSGLSASETLMRCAANDRLSRSDAWRQELARNGDTDHRRRNSVGARSVNLSDC